MLEPVSSSNQLLIPTQEWKDVVEFTNWWNKAGMPILPPVNSEVFVTDDATAFCLFRNGQFQVELYLIHPNPMFDNHEHPGVEIIQMNTTGSYGSFSEILRDGDSHGNLLASRSQQKGLSLLTFEHWLKDEPSTAAAAWKGLTVGPKQEMLIRRFYPNAFIESGYADITKPVNYRQLLLEGKA